MSWYDIHYSRQDGKLLFVNCRWRDIYGPLEEWEVEIAWYDENDVCIIIEAQDEIAAIEKARERIPDMEKADEC